MKGRTGWKVTKKGRYDRRQSIKTNWQVKKKSLKVKSKNSQTGGNQGGKAISEQEAVMKAGACRHAGWHSGNLSWKSDRHEGWKAVEKA